MDWLNFRRTGYFSMSKFSDLLCQAVIQVGGHFNNSFDLSGSGTWLWSGWNGGLGRNTSRWVFSFKTGHRQAFASADFGLQRVFLFNTCVGLRGFFLVTRVYSFSGFGSLSHFRDAETPWYLLWVAFCILRGWNNHWGCRNLKGTRMNLTTFCFLFLADSLTLSIGP